MTEWFEEKRTAKKLTGRAALEGLRDRVRLGRVRVLYVYRLDRLSRSGIRDTFEIIGEFRARGVQIVTVADGFTLEGPAADVVVAVLAWAAQMERLAIGERIADAHRRITEAGGNWGRPKRVDRKLEAELVEAHAKGRSVRQLAITYKVPRSTVARVLSQKPKPARPLIPGPKKALDRGVAQ